MKYFIVFSAYIDERKRPEGFPKVVKSSSIVQVDSPEELILQVEGLLYKNFVQHQSVGVHRDPSKVENLGQIDIGNRMWVPLHMITCVIPNISLITETTTVLDLEAGS